MLRVANHSKRSIDEIRTAWIEFKTDISNPIDAMLLAAALIFVAVLMLLPWLGAAHFQ